MLVALYLTHYLPTFRGKDSTSMKHIFGIPRLGEIVELEATFRIMTVNTNDSEKYGIQLNNDGIFYVMFSMQY